MAYPRTRVTNRELVDFDLTNPDHRDQYFSEATVSVVKHFLKLASLDIAQAGKHRRRALQRRLRKLIYDRYYDAERTRAFWTSQTLGITPQHWASNPRTILVHCPPAANTRPHPCTRLDTIQSAKLELWSVPCHILSDQDPTWRRAIPSHSITRIPPNAGHLACRPWSSTRRRIRMSTMQRQHALHAASLADPPRRM